MTSLPDSFVLSARESLGEDVAARLFAAVEAGESVTAVRANLAKIPAEALAGHFKDSEPEPVPWCTEAFYLKHRPVFALDPWFHAGAYYVQDASSMFVASLVKGLKGGAAAGGEAVPQSLRILDLCAAPGGKSTSVASLLSDNDLLVSNEVISSRATVLAENMTKWGCPNAVVTSSDPSAFAAVPGFFDIMLTDVPCSGEGMFRKDAGAVGEWSADNVALCASRQRRIVSDVWPALKCGGYLIYSTCTFNHFENDDNVEWICAEFGAEVVPVDSVADTVCTGALKTRCGLQFVPGTTRGEGLFVALLRKNGTAVAARRKPDRQGRGAKKCDCRQLGDGFNSYNVTTSSGEQIIKGYPAALEADIRFLEGALRVIRSGIAAATVKGKDLIPSAALALSTALAAEAYPSAEMDLEQALAYLRLQPVTIPDAPRGFVLLRYKGVAQGFVKNLGNRCNNLFPAAWRLRM